MTFIDLPLPRASEPLSRSPRRVSAQKRRLRLYALLVLVDVLTIALAFAAAGLFHGPKPQPELGLRIAELALPLYLFAAFNNEAIGFDVLENWKEGLRKALLAFAFALFSVLFVAFYARATFEFSRLAFTLGSGFGLVLITASRFCFDRFVKYAVGSQLRSEVIIVDRSEFVDAPEGATMIDAASYGLGPDPRDPLMLDRLGHVVEGADYVLVSCPPEDRAAWSLLLKGTNVPGHILAPEFDALGASQISRYGDRTVIQVASGPLDLRNRALKRLMDLSITVPAIVLFSPLLVLVALLIKIDSPGPVFFRQQRMGRGNRLFHVLKFRSMHVSACDSNGTASTERGDARITRVGRFIRRTSIDELPQLFNVLNSDMSLVGPRPHALGSTAGMEFFWEVDERYWHRHSLKPGVTGLAQTRGLRGPTHSREDLVRRLQADLEYLNDWSIWLDFTILIATVRVIIHPNAY